MRSLLYLIALVAVVAVPAYCNKDSDLSKFLQVDDLDSGQYDESLYLPENLCARRCFPGDAKTCYYKFEFEAYTTLNTACGNCITNTTSDCYSKGCVTADGYERAILTINRRMPAPSIQVCQGDTIIADVVNKMPGRTTAIHWHGMRQVNSKFMDGVPMVTQCPIGDSETFRYHFVAEDAGFYFYHSHSGLQKVDGLVGSLVIRQPRVTDPHIGQYDFDLPSHVIVVQDWYHLVADSMFPGLQYHDSEQVAATYLIQGRGQYVFKNGTTLAKTPYAEFNVTKGFRYLFRIVAGTCFECQYTITIENHEFTIIEADAEPVVPYKVTSLTMSPGERFTVVINCDQPLGNYWIQVRGISFCKDKEAYQLALLKYKGASDESLTAKPTYKLSRTNQPGITMNPLNSKCTEESKVKDGPCIHDLRSVKRPPHPGITKAQPDVRLVWAFGFYKYKNDELFDADTYPRFLRVPVGNMASTINGKALMFPSSPILYQREDIPLDIFCPMDDDNATAWNVDDVECVHLMKVPANKIVEIVSIDVGAQYNPDGLSHSIHLHGYDSYVMEFGVLAVNKTRAEAWYELLDYLKSDRRKPIPHNPVAKDTWPLTAGGYTVTRIYTDNPGYWFFHCHFAYHLESGMAGILQVGEHEGFPKPPKDFPKCGNYLAKK